MDPRPVRASKPLPVTSELPQCARLLNDQRIAPECVIRFYTIFLLSVGRTESVCPVHARSALPASIQSSEPSRCTIAKDVARDFVDMSALNGVVETTLW